MQAVTMARNSGVKFMLWVLQAHAGWFQTGWCDAAHFGSVARRPVVAVQRS
jgi:hypothetical protein